MLLVYIGKEINKNKLLNILNKTKINYKLIYDTNLEMRVGALLKLEELHESKNTRKSFLYFSDISDEEMDTLRDAMKKSSIYIPRIAVMTEHNIHWTLKELMDAIDEEVEYFKMKEAILEKVKKPNMERMKTDLKYQMTIRDAFINVRNDNYTLEECKAIYKYLYKI